VKRLVPLFLSAAALLVACRQYLPTNRYLQMRPVPSHGTADARRSFDHAKHAGQFEKAGVVCLDCHRFDTLIETGEPELAAQLSGRAQYPGGTACHFCHGPSDTRMASAPQACRTCHENLMPLRPADHDLSWERVHAQIARVNPTQCDSCHRQAECIDCHQRRDTVRERVHDRNFLFIHGIQATANPMQCGSCHREDFCIRCHQATRDKR
jgi:hypothetical protein